MRIMTSPNEQLSDDVLLSSLRQLGEFRRRIEDALASIFEDLGGGDNLPRQRLQIARIAIVDCEREILNALVKM